MPARSAANRSFERTPTDCVLDNLQEFRDPLKYDLEELPGSANRIAFICKRSLISAGSTLDLACWTGIVSLPVALLGLLVTGVDLSEPMISHARHKARTLGDNATFSVQDMRLFNAPMEFKFITLTGNAFQALLTQADQLMLLQAVARLYALAYAAASATLAGNL